MMTSTISHNWLSIGNMLKRVYELREEIILFLKDHNFKMDELDNSDWITDLTFLVDMRQHLNELNTKMQGKNNLIHNLFNLIKSFQRKLVLWQTQLRAGILAYFPTMSKATESIHLADFRKHIDLIENIKDGFNSRFQDVRKFENSFELFSLLFHVDIETVPVILQMELIDLQSNTELKTKFGRCVTP
ncbi:hypothetical protein ANN_13022 [Periplaneta americana]|uniref:General transcription factor II-I repeat domain-containing protein 2 n=1 Tax=Periplaneta americana TaxID=6978 RepID=A0ABQ8TKT6_PERAM|nr:hypothetical protein ANN_13022 [Periplaneta americana]